MKLRGLIDEDFTNYRKPSMFVIFPYCTLKCDVENKVSLCQNSTLLEEPLIEVNETTLLCRYLSNKITKALVFGGLEPMDSFSDVEELLSILREQFKCEDDVVIYTGYNKEEIEFEIEKLRKYKNIIVKFGRYIPNQKPHLDEILGVELASDNQFAEKIS